MPAGANPEVYSFAMDPGEVGYFDDIVILDGKTPPSYTIEYIVAHCAETVDGQAQEMFSNGMFPKSRSFFMKCRPIDNRPDPTPSPDFSRPIVAASKTKPLLSPAKAKPR